MTEKEQKTDTPIERPIPQEKVAVTQHAVTIGGQEVAYTATAGTLILRQEDDEDGKEPAAKAEIFFVAYTRNDVADAGARPLTFSFNGGPGSSSAWLHLGLLGPRRVLMQAEPLAPPPPYQLVDNEYALLDVSDLVFIDPVTTGYSRTIPEEKPAQFHDFQKDIESVGEFIRLYTTRYKRWRSPKFLIGESYGTTRAAGLSGHLQERYGMYLNGVMLVSSILDFQTARFDPGNDLPYLLFLPTYTATAWYHGQLVPELQQDLQATLRQVEAFAQGPYALSLMKGDALPDTERAEIAEQLARYTGLAREYVEQTNLRINIHRFVKELLRRQRRTVGRLDSRFTGIDRDAADDVVEYDPSYAAIQGVFSTMLNDYLRSELDFESDLPYEILTERVRPWRYEQHQNQYVNVAETLRKAMCQNQNLRVFIANGYYDLATPYLATEYTVNHLALDPILRDNLAMAYYEAGHMMYVHGPSLAQLKDDLAGFIAAAIPDRHP
ncbi:MAG: peptidase S10 [Chloroflexia bacterium]|nr:peptidase S10 [Chloroflexia bacterium]